MGNACWSCISEMEVTLFGITGQRFFGKVLLIKLFRRVLALYMMIKIAITTLIPPLVCTISIIASESKDTSESSEVVDLLFPCVKALDSVKNALFSSWVLYISDLDSKVRVFVEPPDADPRF